MTDKVLCPYCGSEMKSSGWVSLINGNLAYTVCSNNRCKSAGPYVRGYETMDEARAAALAAAQARYLPPNRPLTLDEVKALETDNWMCTPAWVEFADCKKTIESGQIRLAPNVLEGYGRDFRVWLRKPTQAEMDAAGWGDAYEPATND